MPRIWKLLLDLWTPVSYIISLGLTRTRQWSLEEAGTYPHIPVPTLLFPPKRTDNTSQQDFGTRKVYCVSNVTFHAESKYAIKIFPSPTVFVQWPF